MSHSGDEICACICSTVYVCGAPPTVGAWSMSVLLWQLFEYYYYSLKFTSYDIIRWYKRDKDWTMGSPS